MSKVYNPLLDKRRKRIKDSGTKISQEITASEDNVMEGDGPISPVSNRRMVRAMCGNIPVWADLQARLVLPIKKGM